MARYFVNEAKFNHHIIVVSCVNITANLGCLPGRQKQVSLVRYASRLVEAKTQMILYGYAKSYVWIRIRCEKREKRWHEYRSKEWIPMENRAEPAGGRSTARGARQLGEDDNGHPPHEPEADDGGQLPYRLAGSR